MSARVLTILFSTTALLAMGAAPQEKGRDGSKLVTKVYQVTDLVTPIVPREGWSCIEPPKSDWFIVGPAINLAKGCTSNPPKVTGRTEVDALIAQIKTRVAPGSWGERGPCTIEYHPLPMAIVVGAPPDVQEQIADLLACLRREQDREVAIELRFLTVADSVYEQLMTDFGLKRQDSACMMGVLNEDKHVYQLMEACQSHPRTGLMQAPKITMFNGQAAKCRICDQQQFVTGMTLGWKNGTLAFLPLNETICLGLQIGLETSLVQEGKAVKLDLKINHTALDSDKTPLLPVLAVMKRDGMTGQMVGSMESYPTGSGFPKFTPEKLQKMEKGSVLFSQFIQTPKVAEHSLDEELTVGDGKTAVLFGWDTTLHSEHRLPVLSELPCVGHLFRQAHQEPGKVLVLVTPRVIIQQEEEERQTGLLPSPPCKAALYKESAGGSEEAEAGSQIEDLLAKYHKACATGKFEKARKIAVKALKIDPACFDKNR